MTGVEIRHITIALPLTSMSTCSPTVGPEIILSGNDVVSLTIPLNRLGVLKITYHSPPGHARFASVSQLRLMNKKWNCKTLFINVFDLLRNVLSSIFWIFTVHLFLEINSLLRYHCFFGGALNYPRHMFFCWKILGIDPTKLHNICPIQWNVHVLLEQ